MITLKKSIEQGFSGNPNGLYDVLTEIQTSIAALESQDTSLKSYWASGVYGATITVGSANTATVTATVQLTDYLGEDLAIAGSVWAYLSDDADGLDACATSPTTDLANGTDGECQIVSAEHVYLLTSEADGDIDLTLGYTTNAHDFYLVIVLPNGKRVVSSKWEFSA